MRTVLLALTCVALLGCSDDDNGNSDPTLANAIKHLCDCAESDYCTQCTDLSHPDCAVCKDRQSCEAQMTTELSSPTESCFTCVLNAACADLVNESSYPCKSQCEAATADGG